MGEHGGCRLFANGACAVAATPLAAGAVALVWKFPVFMGGVMGGPGAVIGAALTAVIWLTIGSLMLGTALVFGLGAGVGRLLRRSPVWASITVSVSIGVILAVAYAVIGVTYT